MPYNEALAVRVRTLLDDAAGITEKKMFGGLAFLQDGNMLVCIWKQALIVRLGPDEAEMALREPHTREFDVTGKPMRGWIMVDPGGLDSVEALADWIKRASDFVSTLPAKDWSRR